MSAIKIRSKEGLKTDFRLMLVLFDIFVIFVNPLTLTPLSWTPNCILQFLLWPYAVVGNTCASMDKNVGQQMHGFRRNSTVYSIVCVFPSDFQCFERVLRVFGYGQFGSATPPGIVVDLSGVCTPPRVMVDRYRCRYRDRYRDRW